MARGTIVLNEDQARMLGTEIMHRRVAMGYRSARALSRQTGLDYRTITAIESGRARSVERSTLATIEVGLNWPAGTTQRLLDQDDRASLDLTLTMADDISEELIVKAKEVAQAAFDAYIEVSRGA